MKRIIFFAMGTLFGFLLSRAGATTYDYYAQLFLFENFQLLWVISGAVAVGIVGMTLLKKTGARSLLERETLTFNPKPYKSWLIPGSLMMGIGWGLAAACPGTVLAMLGEGKLASLFVIAGITIGTYAYGWQMSRREKQQTTPSTAEV